MYTYWIVNLIGIGVVLFLCWRINILTGDWFTHAHFFSVVWGVNLFAEQFLGSGILFPDLSTVIVMILAWWSFLIGSFVVLKKVSLKTSETLEAGRKRSADINRSAALVLIGALVLLQYAGIYSEIQAFRLPIGAYLYDLISLNPTIRINGVAFTAQLPWYLDITRTAFVWYLPLALLLHSRRRISITVLSLIVLLAVLSTPGRFTRAPLIMVVITFFVSWGFCYQVKTKTKLAVLGSVALAFCFYFVSLQIAINMTAATRQPTTQDTLFSYVGGSVKTYEQILQNHFPDTPTGFYSFDSINYLLFKLSIIKRYPEIVRPYITIPITTNLYTYLDAFTLDFGIAGAIIGSFLLGAFVSWFYGQASRGLNAMNLSVYSYLVYCCVMTPANNEFIRFALPLYLIVAILFNGVVANIFGGQVKRRLDSGEPQLDPGNSFGPIRPAILKR